MGGSVYERCLNEAERILAADKDIIVPVKKVWMEVKRQAEEQNFEVPSFADLTAMMEADNRFEFMPVHNDLESDVGEGLSDDRDASEEELENLGFYSGDRVKLRRIELSPEIIGDVIRKKVDMTMEALAKAWEMRPQGDQETEDQLLEILSKTQKLQRQVKENFSEEKMKALSDASQRESKNPRQPPKKVSSKARKKKGAIKRSTPRKRTVSTLKKGRRK